jgi:hypothetical protein
MKVEKTTSKAWSLALVGATYLVAVGVATLWLGLGVHTGRLWLNSLIAGWSQSGVHQLRCWLIATVVVRWVVRLTAHWLYAFPGLHHEDWRYPMFRERAG